jgi:hypothetical protein
MERALTHRRYLVNSVVLNLNYRNEWIPHGHLAIPCLLAYRRRRDAVAAPLWSKRKPKYILLVHHTQKIKLI